MRNVKELYRSRVHFVTRLGVFILLSSEDMGAEEILPLYYTRQQIEQVFDIGKNNADLLPLRLQNEDAFRGHLMLRNC